MTESEALIDIVPLLSHIYLPTEQWFEFLKKCHEKDIDAHDYLTIALQQELENALKYPELLG